MDLSPILIPAISAASITFLVTMLFIEWRRSWIAHGLLISFSVGALALPLYGLRDVLGRPDPAPATGEYRLIGYKSDEYAKRAYFYVSQGDAIAPKYFSVPFNYQSALQLHELANETDRLDRLTVAITRSDDGTARYRATRHRD